MNIELPAELENWLTRMVRAGRFASPGDGVAEALGLLREAEEAGLEPAGMTLDELETSLAEAEDDIQHGRIAPVEALLTAIQQQLADHERRKAQ